MKSVCCICLLMLSSMVGLPAQAAAYLVGASSSNLQEHSVDQDLVWRRLKGIRLGGFFDHYLATVEISNFETSSSTGLLSVARKVESNALGVSQVGENCSIVCTLWGGGFGWQTELIDTQVGGISSQDRGRPNYFIFASLGAKLDIPYFWLSAEVRLTGYERWEPNPTPVFLATAGLYF